nr:hypothetical protein [Tanacetum cinerariifolium]
MNKMNTTSCIGLSMESNVTVNEDTSVVLASAVKEGTTTAGNASGKSSYANVTGKPSGKKLNFRTLFTPEGNGIDVVVPVESIHVISERFAYTSYGFSGGSRWHTLLLLTMSSYARAMIELQADVELKDNIVMAMPKITGEGHYTCNISVEFEWKPPRCASCVSVGPKVGFKPHKEYRPVPKKPNASSSGNKKKGVEPIIEVSNSNPFEVLVSVDNDVELGSNEGTSNLVNNVANSSGSSFMNVDNSSTGTTPITDKIGKFEDLLTSGQAILVDEAGNPLKKDLYGNGDYDEDPYDDDMYEGQDLPQEIQAICDNRDIGVKGRKKK